MFTVRVAQQTAVLVSLIQQCSISVPVSYMPAIPPATIGSSPPLAQLARATVWVRASQNGGWLPTSSTTRQLHAARSLTASHPLGIPLPTPLPIQASLITSPTTQLESEYKLRLSQLALRLAMSLWLHTPPPTTISRHLAPRLATADMV